MGLGMVIASLFFLFNPDVHVIDVLPDFIGYMLMTSGLSQLAMVNEYIFEAHEKFTKMIWVGLAKFASLALLYMVFDASNRAAGMLLFSFSFAIIELIFLIPAYSKLFEGITYLSGRRGGETVFVKKGNKTFGERVKSYTTVFVIAKAVCATLPETLSLSISEFTDNFVMYLYDFIIHFRIIGVTVGLVFGIIWLVRTTKFFKLIAKEEEFIGSLTQSFEEIAVEREGLFIQKNIYRGLIILIAGAVLCVDLHLPDYNIIPDFVSAILFCVGAYMLKRYVTGYKKVMIASAFYFAFSVAASVLKVIFLDEYGFFTAVNYKEEAYFLFMGMVGATIAENVAFLAVVFAMIFMLREVVDKYTGAEIMNDANKETQKTSSAQRALYTKLWISGTLAVLAAVCSVSYEFLLIERGFFTDIMWAVDFAVSAVFAASVIFGVLALFDDIKAKYMYS